MIGIHTGSSFSVNLGGGWPRTPRYMATLNPRSPLRGRLASPRAGGVSIIQNGALTKKTSVGWGRLRRRFRSPAQAVVLSAPKTVFMRPSFMANFSDLLRKLPSVETTLRWMAIMDCRHPPCKFLAGKQLSELK